MWWRRQTTAGVALGLLAGATVLSIAGAGGRGYEIRPVDCGSIYQHFGCLHCLVNVLRRN
jgi:hypothetical protein